MKDELTSVWEGSQTLQGRLHIATKEICELQQTNKVLHAALADITNGRGRKRSMASDYEAFSDRHKRRLVAQRKVSCSSALHWLENNGYIPLRVEVKNIQTGSTESIELNTKEVFGQNAESITDDDLQIINMMLFVKDKYNISSRAYHELAKICKSMPRYYKVQQRIAELNLLWNIKPTPNNTCGVQQSLQDRLRQRVQHLHHTTSLDAPFRKNLSLHVKLSGDGTNIGKRLHVVNFSFTLLEEGAMTFRVLGFSV